MSPYDLIRLSMYKALCVSKQINSFPYQNQIRKPESRKGSNLSHSAHSFSSLSDLSLSTSKKFADEVAAYNQSLVNWRPRGRLLKVLDLEDPIESISVTDDSDYLMIGC